MKIYLLLFVLLLPIRVFALKTELIVERIILLPTGLEYREIAESVDPGDILEYTFRIENDGRFKGSYLEPAIPIPLETNLIPKSIYPSNFRVSVDGINFIEFPVYDKNKDEIPASAYKIIKWYINELLPKEVVDVKFRVRVNS